MTFPSLSFLPILERKMFLNDLAFLNLLSEPKILHIFTKTWFHIIHIIIGHRDFQN